MLARLQSGDGHRRMPMVGRGNSDGVNVFLFECPAKVFLRDGSLAHFLSCALCELFENIAVHIADMRDAGSAAVRLEGCKVGVGAAIKTDHGKVESLIRPKYLAIAFCRGSYSQARRAHSQSIEELSSCSHRFSLSLVLLSQTATPDLSPADKKASGQQEIPA